MKILVTGSKGFIGKHLVLELSFLGHEVLSFDVDTPFSMLRTYCRQADFVYHLAGVNRPREVSEFMEGNYEFTGLLLRTLKETGNKCPILMSSSIQALQDNPYGKSKKAAEESLIAYGKECDVKILIYRLQNVFGKWCRPNYNSVIATFCYNIGRDLPIEIHDINAELQLVHIDDVIKQMLSCIQNEAGEEIYGKVDKVFCYKLIDIVALLYTMKYGMLKRELPDLSDEFVKKLYSTFLSYLEEENLSYELKMNRDTRGSFTEFIKTEEKGQISINVSKPGAVKGNHYHHTKHETFLVVKGRGVIRLRNIYEDKVIEYYVDDTKLMAIEIPSGYTHNIENLGSEDMVTVIWANECFDKENPDTYYLKV